MKVHEGTRRRSLKPNDIMISAARIPLWAGHLCLGSKNLECARHERHILHYVKKCFGRFGWFSKSGNLRHVEMPIYGLLRQAERPAPPRKTVCAEPGFSLKHSRNLICKTCHMGCFFFLVGDPMKQWFWQRTLELYNWCTVGSIPPFLGGYVLCHLSDSRHAQQQGRFRRNHKAGLSNRARQVKFFTHACSSARQWNWSDSILFSLCRCSDWSVSFATVSLLSFSFFVNHYYLSPKQKFHRHVRTFFKVWLRV